MVKCNVHPSNDVNYSKMFYVVVIILRGPVLGSFNNWNIILLSQKSTPSDKFDEINQVVLDGISDNMVALVESVKYVSINTTNTKTNAFYVIMFT